MSNTIHIELIDHDGNEVTSFELPSNPFKVGELVRVIRTNRDKQFWDVEDHNGVYKVLSVQHDIEQIYSANKKYYDTFCVSIEVEKID